jgi:nucleotide-binding universal stress UspA family protein
MVERVLVPVDESERSRTALEYALETYPDASLTVLHVIDPRDLRTYGGIEGWVDLEEIGRQQRDHAEEVVENARERAAERGVTVATEVVVGKAPRAIVEYAEEHGVDLVVMGSHGRSGVSRVLLGSVAERVVRRSPTPVTVVR